MTRISLPANSKFTKGNYFKGNNLKLLKKINVYRWNPDKKSNPTVDTFEIDIHECGQMVLDALILIKDQIDPSLTFRRSCREGVCGSCAMNIDGRNTLACQKNINEINGDINVFPLTHQPVIKDLVVDLSHAFKQLEFIEPWLQKNLGKQTKTEQNQSIKDRSKIDGLWECILCFSCTTSCVSYWWNGKKYLGPAALLQASRWVNDSRDNERKKRLKYIEKNSNIHNCHSIMNCSNSCPKGLNPAKAIADLKKQIATNL
ncbi:MAG: Succinate dehydrogenase iron-sulfur subunit [Alphaproteobacteria bacterium MarineAlpha5_Bin7]|mgnify:FL=1|nr:MAG: Succinate dehydrogenase iron-sulfur subunit [Alphaproteobacteria bacterium MarineAlpha5_Bin7]|tara:strand:+ start:996 stop:1772 length:777 start_codon:yes stop_codon:yes gene_type:complete